MENQPKTSSGLWPVLSNLWGFMELPQTLFVLPFAFTAMVLAARSKFLSLPESERMLAEALERGWPGWRLVLLIFTTMVTARACAVAFNRIVDRTIDKEHPRRRHRHLPSGRVGLLSAYLLAILSGLGFVAACWFINTICFYLSPVALGLSLLYSYAKRITHFTHFILGAAMALAPLGAWLAVTGEFKFVPPAGWRYGLVVPVVMSVLVICWTVGFDIIKSIGDYEFDKKQGLFSMVVYMGPDNALQASLLAHMLMVGCMTVFGLLCGFKLPFWIGLMVILCCLGMEHWIARKRSLDWAKKAFHNLNTVISMVFLAVVIAEVAFPNFWKFRGW